MGRSLWYALFQSGFILFLYSCQAELATDTLFTHLPADRTNIHFRNTLRETEEFNVMKYGYFYNGGGVAIGDVNNDELPDIYFTGNLVASRLYINRGDWRFDEVAETAGVAAAGLWNTGTTMADVNGDGQLDIYVCRSAAADPARRKNLLFINTTTENGTVSFTEQAEAYGLADPGYSTQASFFDYDRDGDLDMFLLNHSTQEYAGFNKLTASHKQRINPMLGDKLYRNDGKKFTDVSREAGIIQNVLGFGLGVAVSDVNADGWYDIYVTNDYNEEDYLYLNQQDGTFRESLTTSIGHTSLFSMGCDAADINNDALPDIVTLDMLPESSSRLKMSLGPENYDKYDRLIRSGFHEQTMRNMLQLNNGLQPAAPERSPSDTSRVPEVTFSEVGQLAGVGSTDWSWAALLADYDNDGLKDLFVTNGYMRNYLDMDFMNFVVGEKLKSEREQREVELMHLVEAMPAIEVANYAFRNEGDLSFRNHTTTWGLGGNSLSNGAAYADLDGDGDLDLVVNNVNAEAGVYRNNSEAMPGHHYLKIRCQGNDGNTRGIGTKAYIYTDGKVQFQELIPVRGFQSSVNPELVVGVGEATRIDSIRVVWPNGMGQTFSDVAADQTLNLQQPKASLTNVSGEEKPERLPWFRAIHPTGIAYHHRENDFLDFKRDKLLAQGISTSGPKIVVGDANGDGQEDFYLGSAKGMAGQLYTQQYSGQWTAVQMPAPARNQASEDTDGLFFDADNDGDDDLYVVSGGSDFAEGDPDLQDRLYLNDGRGNFSVRPKSLPSMPVSGSTVAAADMDQDGDLDLFVGGRLVPGRYPQAPRSYLLRNDGQGNFTDVTQTFCPALSTPGMITDAVWADLNQDSLADLTVVGEWMPIRVFINHADRLEEVHADTLSKTPGWWNTVIAFDIDQDGDTDLLAGNQGMNNPFRATAQAPVTLVYADFDENGSIDPILNYYLDGKSEVAFSRDELIGQMVSLRKKFPSYRAYADATLSDFFSESQLAIADTLRATLFESVLLRNDGNSSFSIEPLPREAQFAPVYAIAATHLNEDTYPDLIVGGNLSRTRVSTGQYDANHGMVFLGREDGGFTYATPAQTGLLIRGDVRSIVPLEDRIYFSRNDDSLAVFQRLPHQ